MMIKNFKNFVFEKVNATIMYVLDNYIDSVISGDRDVAFVNLDENDKQYVKDNRLKYVKIKQRNFGYSNNMYVVYSNKHKADILINILKKHGGFLRDNTPEEAIENGRALEYDDNSINDFISKKYNTTIEKIENH